MPHTDTGMRARPADQSGYAVRPDALRLSYEAFLAANGIAVAGIEFIAAVDGTLYTYDVNTNTNYNPEAEARAGRSAMDALAR